MARDSNGNFAIGGSTMSSSLNSAGIGPNAILVLILASGDVKWHTSFNSVFDSVSAVEFNPAGTDLVFTTYTSSQNYLVFADPTLATYTERASFKIQRNGADDLVKTGPDSLLYDGTDVFVAMQAHVVDSGKNAYRFKIVKFDKNGNVKWEYTMNRGYNGRAFEIIEGLSSDIYVSGYEDKRQNSHYYLAVARILKNQANTQAVDEWYQGSHQLNQQEQYYINKLGIATTTDTKIVGCISQESTTQSIFGISEILLDPLTYAPTATSALYENIIANEVQACQGLYVKNSETFYAYVSFKVAQVQKLATITSSTKAIQYQALPIDAGTMTHSLFIDELYSYYIGSFSSISQVSPIQNFGNKIGYLMSFRIEQSCYTYTYTLDAPVTMTNVIYFFDTPTSLTGPVDLITATPSSLSALQEGSNSINSNFCTATVTLSVPVYADQTYYIADPSTTFSVPAFTLTLLCDDAIWTYLHEYLNPATSPFPPIITYSGLDYTIQTDDQTLVGTYQMKLTGTLQNAQTASRTFDINIVLDCARMVITQGTITASQVYDITSGTALILGTTTGWSQNIGTPGCNQVSFTLTNQADGSSADSIFYISGTEVVVNTQDASKAQVYNLNLVGTSGSVKSELPFTVDVQNQCGSITISTTAVGDTTYFITQTALSIAISSFTTGNTICDNLMIYGITNSDGTNIDTTVFTFDSTNLVLSVFTSDISKVKLYGIKVIGYVIDVATKVEISFNVDIRDNCENLIITKSADVTPTYVVKDPSVTLNAFTFTPSLTTCGSLVFTLLNQDNSNYDPTIFTFDNAAPSIAIQTNDINLAAQYDLKLTGAIGAWSSVDIIITVTIQLGCVDSVLTTSSITAQTYYLTEAALTFQFTHWISSITSCGAITYFTSLSSGSPIDTNLINFDPATRTFTVSSSDPTHIASYSFKVGGSLAAGPSAEITFTLDVLNPCSQVDITPPTVTDQTYYVFGNDLSFVLPIFTYGGAHASCTSFEYTLENADLTPLDGAIFGFDSATRTLSGSSQDPSLIKTYTLKYSGYLYETSVSGSVTFQVNVLHVCTTVTITPPVITPSPVVYTCRDPQIDFSNLAFTKDINNCGSFTYDLVNSDTTPLDTTVFTFDPSTPSLSIQTNDPTKVKSYQLQLTATLQQWDTSSILVDINIEYGCADTTITTYTTTAQTYFVADSALTFSFLDWGSSVTGCTPFTYTPTINSLALDSNYVSFDQANRSFTVSTSDPLYINTYTIDVQGALASGGQSSTIQITLDIKNPCESSVITPPTVNNYLYYVLDTALTDTLPIFTQDLTNPVCSDFTYTLKNSDGTALDTSLFTFDPATKALSIESTNSLKIKVYTLQYEAYLMQPSVSGSLTFQVDVQHLCNTVVITAPADQTVGYVIKDTAFVVSGLVFTQNIIQCGTFTYTLTDDNDNQYDTTILTFDDQVPEISIFTNLISQAGTYILKVTATLGVWGSASTLITVQVSLGCTDTLITPSAIANQQYFLAETPLTISFNDWTSSVTGCTPFYYTASVAGQALDLVYITLDSTTKQFSVDTSDPVYLGSYTVTLVGTLGSGVQNSMTFQLNITNPCVGAAITPPAVGNYIYYVFGNDLSEILPGFTQDLLTPICQTFTYELKNIDDSPLDSLFTFDPSTQTLQATTTDINTIKTYQLKYSAYLLQPSVSNSLTFEVKVLHLCETVTIQVPTDVSLSYREKNPPVDITSLAFTDPLSCGTFTYSLSNFDDSVYDYQVFIFDSATPKITVGTNLVSKVGVYELKLSGQLGSYASAFMKITVNVELGCADTTITPDVVSTYVYELTNPVETFSFAEWQSSVTLCGSFTYSATYSEGNALDASVVQFDGALKEFSVQTSDLAKVQSYTIKITGNLVDGAQASTNFILKIQNPCANVQFTQPTIAKLTYYILGPDLTTTLPPFTHNSAHPACAGITYSLLNIDDSPLDTSIFTFTPADKSLLATSIDLTYIKTYDLKYKASILQQTISSSVNFQLEVKHVCNIVVITQPGDRSENYAVDDPPKVISSLGFTDDLSGLCGKFTYGLTYANGGMIDTGIFTFDPLVPTITVVSNNAAHIMSYFLKLTGTLGTWGFKETLIQVNIVHGCTLTTITTSPIPYFQIYKVTQPALTITFDDWVSSVSGCGTFTYLAQLQDGNALPLYITFDPLTKTFSIHTLDINDKGTFIIDVIGSLVDGATSTVTFQLDIVNPCQLSKISPSSPLNQVFTIPQANIDYVIPNFTQDLSHPICTQFEYLVLNEDETTIDSSLFTFDSATKTLTISTSDESKLGIYKLKLIGYLLELAKQSFSLFEVEIKHVCQVVIITPPPAQQITYYDQTPAITIASLAFTEDVKNCGPFSYQLFNSDGNPFDSTIFTFDSATPEITLSTNSASKAGIYYLKIVATLGQWGQSEMHIQVTIYKSCTEALIFPYKIPNQIYGITAPAKSFTFYEWTADVPGCSSFTYTVTDHLDQALDPNLIQYDSATKTFIVENHDFANIGEILIKIVGQLGIYVSQEYQFKVSLACLVTSVIPVAPIDDQRYPMDGSRMEIGVPALIQSPSCGFPVMENVRMLEGQGSQSLLPEFIDYNHGRQIFVVQTEDEGWGSLVPYVVQVNLWTFDLEGKKTFSYQWNLFMQKQLIPEEEEENQAPYFQTALVTTHELVAGNLKLYNIPTPVDPNQNKVFMTVNCKQIQNFGQCSNSQLIIEPDNIDVGTYYVHITLKDDHKRIPKTSKFQITIVVLPNLDQQQQNSNSNKPKYTTREERVYSPMPEDKDLKVKVKVAKENGVIVLEFNKDISMPDKDQIDPSVLDLQFMDKSQLKDIGFTWECIETTSNEIYIRLKFDDPTLVSSAQDVRTYLIFVVPLQDLNSIFEKRVVLCEESIDAQNSVKRCNTIQSDSSLSNS